MDSFAVELAARSSGRATPVTILGDGVLAEEHARVAGTINYEITCRIESGPARARAGRSSMLDEARRGARRRGGAGSSAARSATSCSGQRGARPRHRLRASPKAAAEAFGEARRRAPSSGSRSAHGAWRVAYSRRAHRRLHAAADGDRGRPRQARLHDQRDRAPARRRRRARPLRRPRRPRPAPHPRGAARASSGTTRCGCCGPSGSRTSSASDRPGDRGAHPARRGARHPPGRASGFSASSRSSRRAAYPPPRRARSARAARRLARPARARGRG